MGVFGAIGKGLNAIGIGADQVQTTEQTQRLDPKSQAFQDETRRQADAAAQTALNNPDPFFLGGETRSVEDIISPFQNQFQQQVIDANAAEFDVARARAVGGAGGTNQQAINAQAQGGSRQGVAEGLRLSELDRAQATQTAGLLSDNFKFSVEQGIPFADRQRALDQQAAQEPLFREQQAAGFRNLGMGPVGQDQTTTQTKSGSIFGDLVGLGTTAAGLFSGGAIPAAASAVSAGQNRSGQFDLPTGLGQMQFPSVG